MTNSRYTNLVLTAIALALTVIGIENLAPSRAAAALQLVVICDVDGHVCLDVQRDMAGSFIHVQPR
jgi:hypothetical protein